MTRTAAPWRDAELTDPVDGVPLAVEPRPGGGAVLTGGARRWPVVDGIPYLRVGRDRLVARAARALDDGDPVGARALLLADQDDWAPDPPPPAADVAAATAPGASLRDAMRLLAFGRVGDYFAYRWSDPTFLAGLALTDLVRGRPAPVVSETDRSVPLTTTRPRALPGRPVVELACGIGHHLRELAALGHPVAGGDVVFAKLWLARRHVVPEARLVCFDAAAPWPLPAASAAVALCHDALYWFADAAAVVAGLRRLVGPDGDVVVGHAHNAAVEPHSAGHPRTVVGWAALFEHPLLFDDDALTAAHLAGTSAQPVDAAALAQSEAIGIVDTPRHGGDVGPGALGLPDPGTPLRLNPLLAHDRRTPAWPSDRYAAEYGPRSGYLTLDAPLDDAVLAAAADGDRTPEIDHLVRRRVLLDLPATW